MKTNSTSQRICDLKQSEHRLDAAHTSGSKARSADVSSMVSLDGPGFLRLKSIVPGIVPVSRSGWYAGVESGRYPSPVSLGGGRAKGYRKADIKALVERLAKGADHV